MLYLPVRIDFIGGWSDQLYWKYHAAVINASVGWSGGFGGFYPLAIDKDGFYSKIEGIGTGLGISSIKRAGEVLLNNKGENYIDEVLKWEEENGTRGGWQDQVGAIEPGLKLIETDDHKNLSIKRFDDHPMWNHLVLFDTGIRRHSKIVGDSVRKLFSDINFIETLKDIVAITQKLPDSDGETFCLTCVESWKRLGKFVEMDIKDLPTSKMVYGYKLVGAGLGGFGICFVRKVVDVPEVINMYTSRKMWATRPVLLNGVKNTDENR